MNWACSILLGTAAGTKRSTGIALAVPIVQARASEAAAIRILGRMRNLPENCAAANALASGNGNREPMVPSKDFSLNCTFGQFTLC
jgi:hypothetical protein